MEQVKCKQSEQGVTLIPGLERYSQSLTQTLIYVWLIQFLLVTRKVCWRFFRLTVKLPLYVS